jgi:hypothetical protein
MRAIRSREGLVSGLDVCCWRGREASTLAGRGEGILLGFCGAFWGVILGCGGSTAVFFEELLGGVVFRGIF